MRINKSLIAYTPTSGAGSGSVSSVALSAPTGFTVSGSPITTSGTLALSFTTGYGIPPLMTGNSGRFLTTNGTTMSWVNIAGTDVTGAALTEVDDTNVTCTLGGTPSTALLRSVSMTLGWAGQLAVSRGGTGAATLTGVVIGNGTSAMTAITGGPNQILRVNGTATGYEFYSATFLTNPMTLNGDMIAQIAGVPGRIAGPTPATKHFLTSTGTGSAANTPTWQTLSAADITGSALTRTNDTNVTITLGGSASTALLNAASLTMGWAGQLAVGRGGTGASTLTGALIGNGTSAVTAVVGTAGQFLRRNTANTAYEFRTLQGGDIAGSELTFSNDTNVTMTLSGTPASALLQPVTIGLGWTGTLSVSRGGIGVGTITGVMIGNGTSAVTGVTGTANQILRRNAGNTAYEFWSANYLVNPMTLEGSLIYATTGGTPAELFANSTGTRKYLSQINGTAPTWEALSFPTGSGTTNYVAKWTNSTVLGNSQIQDDGTNVGIGISPLYKFHVNGSGRFESVLYAAAPGAQLQIAGGGTTAGIYQAASSSILYIANWANSALGLQLNVSNGNLGLNVSPTYKLQVAPSSEYIALNTGDGLAIYNPSLSGANLFFGINGSGGSQGALIQGRDGTASTFAIQLQPYGGNVGIGVNPSVKLDVNGSINLTSANYITWGGAYGANIPTISGTSGTGAFLQFYPSGSSSGVKMALRDTGQLALPSYTTSTSFTGTAVASLAVTNAGDVITIAPSQTTASGTYTPTYTGLANVDSTTAYTCQYSRVGDTVTVSGYVMINATADNTATRLSITLPVSSTTSSVNYANGTIAQVGGGAAGSIIGYGANTAEIGFSVLANTGDVYYSFIFAYRII